MKNIKSPFLDEGPIAVKSKRLGKRPAPPAIAHIFKRFIHKRLDKICPDKTRVIARFFKPRSDDRVRNIINKVLALKEAKVRSLLTQVLRDFSGRHKNIEEILKKHFNEIKGYIDHPDQLSAERKSLIGSYFTMEYSIEAAALFNPSVVIYPKQNDLDQGQTRIIFSFRATGEGHISSIVFRSAVIDKNNDIFLEPVSRYVATPNIVLDPAYNKMIFARKLKEAGLDNDISRTILDRLTDEFTFSQIQEVMKGLKQENLFPQTEMEVIIDHIYWLARSNYEAEFPPDYLISERVLFPVSANESNGLEDARFVRFIDTDGQATYYATYTAYNGLDILPQIIETEDFHHFKMITLNGRMVQNKGMALFPRKINSKYAMISRVDGENLYLMYSDNIHFWNEAVKIQEPDKPWELVQIGNCGSPIETAKGWILLTHGVGPMRKYCIGAELLDLADPSKIIGRLNEPLISPPEEERDGYVPNVVYSCGSIIRNGDLIIPYATSDYVSHLAIISVEELLKKMLSA